MSLYFWVACGGGVLTSLALGWLHRHDLAIAYRIWKLNQSLPDARPIPEADPWPALSDSPWRPEMSRRVSLNTLPRMKLEEVERAALQGAAVYSFHEKRRVW